MEPILNFAQLTAHLKKLNHRKRIAVVCANDPNTEYAISRALEEGIAEFLMIGDSTILKKYPTLKQYPEYVKTIHIENPDEAAREAVRIVREGGADILMKGIINTDNLLHAILDKEKGLLPKGKILTHLAVMEIPTYPYDQEYISWSMRASLAVDRCFRHRMAKLLDGIVTFSSAETIFGGRTIRISNGIDFDATPMRSGQNDTSHELHLIGVAEVHYWHGFDRLVRGLAEYYRTNPEYKVYFHIVGPLSGEREREEILPVIRDHHLEEYVILHGPLHGEELDEQFERADFAIGSLGRHRSGITEIKTLKNREYAARGFAFTYSETDADFDAMPYVWKVPADESAVDVPKLIAFQRSLKISPVEIRESVRPLSWKAQMQKVIEEVGLKKTTDE